MKSSTIKSREELPLILNSKQMSEALGVNVKTLSAFLEQYPSCPSFRMGSRGMIKAPRDAFFDWIDRLSTQNAPQTA